MTDLAGSDVRQLGYCTNVHSGAHWKDMLGNLRRIVPEIRAHLGDVDPLPIGLWLSNAALDEVDAATVQDAVHEIEASVFTLNGFPYGNFHDTIVKHRVYQPDWSTQARLDYTVQLATLLADLVTPGTSASISTLPIGWGRARGRKSGRGPSPPDVSAAAARLRTLSESLRELEHTTGVCVHVDLEPEPGCLLDRAADVVGFFEDHLLPGGNEATLRRHIRVCHDTCHAAVNFEPQAEAIATYDAAGIHIGKVQVSAALAGTGSTEDRDHLAQFAEPRWLHQVSIWKEGASQAVLHDDLQPALLAGPDRPGDRWRVHVHVPVHRSTIGSLRTTQPELLEAISLLAPRPEILAWEVETYAWDALPKHASSGDMARDIAEEIVWTRNQLESATP